MKILLIALFSISIAGCVVDHIDAEKIDIGLIEQDAILLLETSNMNLAKLPDSISELEPESVLVQANGLYIKLNSSFVEESGLFVPVDRSVDYSSVGADPEYKRLSGNVYSYIIRG